MMGGSSLRERFYKRKEAAREGSGVKERILFCLIAGN